MAAPTLRASGSPRSADPWWVRPGLSVEGGRLTIAGVDAESLARRHGTPLFVYDRRRVAEAARAVQAALAGVGLRHLVRFALKANREPEILDVLRGLGEPGADGAVGIDACSPGEVVHALAHGWEAREVSFTGTNVSDRDLDVLLEHGVHVNLDAVSQLERYGRRAPGSRIGLRLNPGLGVGYHGGLEYSGARPTKFGIGDDRLDDALEAARRHALIVDTVHVHAGSGWLGDRLDAVERVAEWTGERARRLRDAGHPIAEVNVGGGLGRPARDDEPPIDLDRWAEILALHLGPLDVVVACEPGDYLTKDAAILLGEVVTVERRGATTFVGLDLGWNVNPSYFIYRYAQEIMVCRDAAGPRTEMVTVAGHINEAGDVFAEDYPMVAVEEGDIVAILNAGGYHQAMSMTHCLRPTAPAVFLDR